MQLVRHVDLQERDSDGAFHLKWMGPKLRLAFRKGGGDTFSDTHWINHIWKENNNTRFPDCKNSCDAPMYICVIQGHTGGDMIAHELSQNSKEFHKMQYLKIKKEFQKIKKWLTSCKPNRLLDIWGKNEIQHGQRNIKT